jgi:hypothetical protein
MVFPYLKGFHNNKVWFSILFLDICVFLYFRSLVLNNWYQSTFFGHKKGQFFFLFFAYFFKKKKEGRDTLTNPVVFCVEFVEIGCIYEFLSEKKTNLKKKSSETKSGK